MKGMRIRRRISLRSQSPQEESARARHSDEASRVCSRDKLKSGHIALESRDSYGGKKQHYYYLHQFAQSSILVRNGRYNLRPTNA